MVLASIGSGSPIPTFGSGSRSNDVEIDIVGADREPVAKQLLFLGSVKWLETGQFDDHDLIARSSATGTGSPPTRSAHRRLPFRGIRRASGCRLHPSRPDKSLVNR
jgi:hypothetical protein